MRIIFLAIAVSATTYPTCQKLRELNEPCAGDSDCVSNFCSNRQCDVLPGSGQSCSAFLRCGSGLGCSSMFDGICEPIAKEGEKCQVVVSGPHLCDSGLLCYNGVCKLAGAAHTLCSDDRKCGPDLICNRNIVTGESVCSPKLAEGDTCYLKPNECSKGLFCSRKTDKCTQLQPINSECYEDDCKDGLVCLRNRNIFTALYKSHKCQQIPIEGETCTGKCQPGFFCTK